MTHAFCALLVLLSVEGGGYPVPTPATHAWDGVSLRTHVDTSARLSLPVPASDFLVEAHHFPEAVAGEIRHSLLVLRTAGQLLLVDVFENPERLSLQEFFDTHLAFLRDPLTLVIEGQGGTDRTPAILLDQPRTGQAWAQRLAVFQLGQRIVKLSCLDRDDPTQLWLFEQALEQIEELR